MNIYGKRFRGYESIEVVNSLDEESNIKKRIKNLIIVIIILIIILICFYIFKIFRNKTHIRNNDPKLINQNQQVQGEYQFQEIKKYTMNDFKEIIPKTNLNGNYPLNINDIFNSRTLFINERNITNDYIHYLRPLNQKEEEKYNQKLHENVIAEDYSKIKREGQMNLMDYYTLCDKSALNQINQGKPSDEPIISIIISLISIKPELIRSINSIQSQTFKNIEIIIVDDCPSEDKSNMLNYIYENESRIRIFKHSKNMGLWRSRLDGFLYSRGKYILHFDAGDILADNFVLEDIYNLISKYNLDSVRFSFSKTKYYFYFNRNKKFGPMKLYPDKFTKIIYGSPGYDVHEFGYGTIWNRLFRANVFIKGLDLIDIHILNAHKDLWEDMWWNDLIDRTSFSNIVINRLGYIYLYDRNSPAEPKIRDNIEKDKTIKEFIYFWLFDYELLPKNDNKKKLITTLHNYIKKDNTFYKLPMSITFLLSNCPIYDHLLILLYNDPYVTNEDKKFITYLYNNAPKNK